MKPATQGDFFKTQVSSTSADSDERISVDDYFKQLEDRKRNFFSDVRNEQMYTQVDDERFAGAVEDGQDGDSDFLSAGDIDDYEEEKKEAQAAVAGAAASFTIVEDDDESDSWHAISARNNGFRSELETRPELALVDQQSGESISSVPMAKSIKSDLEQDGPPQLQASWLGKEKTMRSHKEAKRSLSEVCCILSKELKKELKLLQDRDHGSSGRGTKKPIMIREEPLHDVEQSDASEDSVSCGEDDFTDSFCDSDSSDPLSQDQQATQAHAGAAVNRSLFGRQKTCQPKLYP